MIKPNFFIVGAPKAGTSALYSFLKQHPEVFVPARKEPHFFGTDLCGGHFFIRDERQYLSLFEGARGAKCVGEGSIFYLYSERAAREIKEFDPLARIIIMLRNPVDLVYALHSQFLFFGNEEIQSFQEALDAEYDRRNGLRLPEFPGYPPQVLFYRKVVEFAPQARRYLTHFPPEQVHVVIHDDFSREPARVFRETCDFLGVDPGFEPQFRVVNPNKKSRSRLLRDFLNNTPPAAQRLIKTLVPDSMQPAFWDTLSRLNRKHVERPPLRLALRRRLEAEFAPDVEALSGLLGRDLTHWCNTAA